MKYPLFFHNSLDFIIISEKNVNLIRVYYNLKKYYFCLILSQFENRILFLLDSITIKKRVLFLLDSITINLKKVLFLFLTIHLMEQQV